jgi:hypothetical protein
MRALIVLAGLLLLLSRDASAGGREDKLVVVDANGKQVGTVVGAMINQVTIALSVNGRSVLLEVTLAVESQEFPNAGSLLSPIRGVGSLRFESRDCTGPPFLSRPANRLLDWGAIAPPGLTLYLPEASGAVPRRIAANSHRSYRDCWTLEYPTVSGPYVPAVAIVDLLTLFTPPFRVEIVE